MSASAEKIQREYYTRTAAHYDDMQMSREDDEHYRALGLIDLLCDRFKIETLLDVGAGSGRGVRFLADRGRRVSGVEPVPALIEQAENRGVPKGLIVEGTGYALPFADGSFHAVFECGVLHHVADPGRVVREMMRVSSKAVFISDNNRFGQGGYAARLLKLFLHKANLWQAARSIQTGGKMYTISEGDGLAYSYSVYDSYNQLAGWADSIWLIPTKEGAGPAASWLNPLLTASHILLCAVRERP